MFEIFRKKMAEHHRIEEEIIFGYDQISDQESRNIIKELLREHTEMNVLIEDIHENLHQEKHIDLVPLLNLLKKHQQTENTVLYPKLDEELDPDDKEVMQERIEEMRK